MLIQRAFLHMARGLFDDPEARRQEAHSQRLEANIQATQSFQPNRITGRHVFLGDCMEAVKASEAPEHRKAKAQEIMSKHTKVYNAMPQATRAEYERRALHMAEAKTHKYCRKLVDLMAERVALGSRQKVEAEFGCSGLTVALCKFSDADWLQMASMWRSPEFSRRAVEASREASLQGHLAISDAAAAEVERMYVPPARHLKPAAPWCKKVCWCRDELHQCALAFETDTEHLYFAFLFAMRSPLVAALLPLEKIDVVLPARSSAEEAAGLYRHTCLPTCAFKAHWGKVVFSGEVETTDATKVSVVRDLVHTHQGQCESYWDSVPLDEYLGDLYQVAQAKAHQAKDLPKGTPTDPAELPLLDKYPWLQPFLAGDDPSAEKNAASSNEPPTPEFVPAGTLSDQELEAVYIALARQRRACEGEAMQAINHFKTSIIGGAWTFANRGVAFDAIKANPKHPESMAWTRKYFPTAQASFAYRKYGDQACSALALLWCRRMEYCFSIYVNQSDPDYVYTRADFRQAPGPCTYLSQLGDNSPLERACQARLAEVLASEPVELWRR